MSYTEQAREDIVAHLARRILRRRAHRERPSEPSPREVLAWARQQIRYLHDAPEGAAEYIAADAATLADTKQDTDINWQQWAFGK